MIPPPKVSPSEYQPANLIPKSPSITAPPNIRVCTHGFILLLNLDPKNDYGITSSGCTVTPHRLARYLVKLMIYVLTLRISWQNGLFIVSSHCGQIALSFI